MKLLLVLAFASICLASAKHDKRLNEGCDMDTDCMSIWAFCNEKKCACMDGFDDLNGVCTPQQLYCPSFILDKEVRLQKPGGPCYSKYNEGDEDFDTTTNCSSTEFCFIHSNVRTIDGNDFGHCCPKPEPKSNITLTTACPTIGKEGGSCEIRPINERFSCPEESHECHSDIPEINGEESCCPIVCRNSYESLSIAFTGRCLNYVEARENCEFNLQCPEGYKCVKNILEGPNPICQKEK